jgi:hypothetical protein
MNVVCDKCGREGLQCALSVSLKDVSKKNLALDCIALQSFGTLPVVLCLYKYMVFFNALQPLFFGNNIERFIAYNYCDKPFHMKAYIVATANIT